MSLKKKNIPYIQNTRKANTQAVLATDIEADIPPEMS